MDPDRDADGDDATAMAQAMGFSSFGTQDPPQKKRRYNAATDAVTSTQQHLQERNRQSATGSNSTPLGTLKQPAANSDEIDLHDDDEDGNSGIAASHRPAEEVPQAITAPPVGLPARPAPGTGFVGSASKPSSQGRSEKNPRRHNELWYQGYYDSTSNENPWERLEKAMGLESKGVWVPRQTHAPMTT
ncbi:hypothetical protein QQS21_010833 [Conoideocrella luteorostrata]|uniref:Uncharacterized protein n=1 Tax=Conoideocrella luteorostrata TaxID=1105319 RepID=A0AAJ0CH01_9HYPO|nr:hypothetical protein QQS21_010833 [Conoideocrella luteorostrata]